MQFLKNSSSFFAEIYICFEEFLIDFNALLKIRWGFGAYMATKVFHRHLWKTFAFLALFYGDFYEFSTVSTDFCLWKTLWKTFPVENKKG